MNLRSHKRKTRRKRRTDDVDDDDEERRLRRVTRRRKGEGLGLRKISREIAYERRKRSVTGGGSEKAAKLQDRVIGTSKNHIAI